MLPHERWFGIGREAVVCITRAAPSASPREVVWYRSPERVEATEHERAKARGALAPDVWSSGARAE